jgi:hypothetical protein
MLEVPVTTTWVLFALVFAYVPFASDAIWDGIAYAV